MNKVALVTGGSGGIGKAISLKLAKEGYDIAINYNGNLEKAESVKKLCEEQGVKVSTYKCDVSKFNEVKKMIEDIVKDFGRIDVLVNNSGITRDGLILRMSEEDFDKVIDVNLKGTFNCIKHISKVMMRQKSGNIVNISSVVGLIGNSGQANYSSSKAGVLGLTKTIARELVGIGVRCNAIAPGFINSEMTDKLSEKVKEALLNTIPMKKIGNPEDVANAVAFLVSDDSSYITGQVLNVNGGMLM